jgi:hypothetical protein
MAIGTGPWAYAWVGVEAGAGWLRTAGASRFLATGSSDHAAEGGGACFRNATGTSSTRLFDAVPADTPLGERALPGVDAGTFVSDKEE